MERKQNKKNEKKRLKNGLFFHLATGWRHSAAFCSPTTWKQKVSNCSLIVIGGSCSYLLLLRRPKKKEAPGIGWPERKETKNCSKTQKKKTQNGEFFCEGGGADVRRSFRKEIVFLLIRISECVSFSGWIDNCFYCSSIFDRSIDWGCISIVFWIWKRVN